MVSGLLFLFAPAAAFIISEWYPMPWVGTLLFSGCMVWIAGIVGVPLAMIIVSDWAREPAPPSICAECGYDLRGNTTGVCPECGEKPA